MKPGKLIGLLVIALGFAGLYLLRESSPMIRLFTASIGMIAVIKVAAAFWQRADGLRFRSPLGAVLYFLAWPGISASGFTERGPVPETTGSRFLESWISFLAGIAVLVGISIVGRGQSTALNYVALVSVLCTVHLGLVEVLADGIRLLGFSPRSLFERPFLSVSLRDFWSMRWNRAFVDMNKLFILKPLAGKVRPGVLAFSIFAVSGLLHELGISYSDGVSWGLPLVYFLIQGAGMLIEKRRKFPRYLVWLWVLAPAPLLFTPSFVDLMLGGLARWISVYAAGVGAPEFFKYGLMVGGAWHLLVLCASVQVPSKLGWRTEFQKLSSMNRKVFWTYGCYIFAIIVFLGVVSFLLSGQDLTKAGTPVLLWLVFIAVFWWARVFADHFYMAPRDWPRGPLFTVGHVCLSTLFMLMATLYTALAVVAWH